MTREEAIEQLNFMIETIPKEPSAECDSIKEWLDTDKDIRNALEMAIKALEVESYEDAVSREEAIRVLQENCSHWDTNVMLIDIATDLLKKLPSVTPIHKDRTVQDFVDRCRECGKQKTKWIPCSERLPEKNVEVLATTEWSAVTIAEMYSANDWFIHEGTTNAEIDEIVAWMPLPEPYKAESEG